MSRNVYSLQQSLSLRILTASPINIWLYPSQDHGSLLVRKRDAPKVDNWWTNIVLTRCRSGIVQWQQQAILYVLPDGEEFTWPRTALRPLETCFRTGAPTFAYFTGFTREFEIPLSLSLLSQKGSGPTKGPLSSDRQRFQDDLLPARLCPALLYTQGKSSLFHYTAPNSAMYCTLIASASIELIVTERKLWQNKWDEKRGEGTRGNCNRAPRVYRLQRLCRGYV